MAVFVWNEKFSVGMKSMDDQHKHFLNLLNNLNDEIQLASGDKMVEAAIHSLADYGTRHFRDEEKILLTCGYSGTEHQRKEHSFFVKQVHELATRYQGGSRVYLVSVVSQMRDWFINHIMIEDKKYAEFI